MEKGNRNLIQDPNKINVVDQDTDFSGSDQSTKMYITESGTKTYSRSS